jgi:L-rhamnose mutarotase
MKRRFGQMIGLKPSGINKYILLHKEVWPGVLEMITDCNIENYSIFLKDNYLFSYFEYTGDNYTADMAKMASDPVTQQWWNIVKPLMEPIESRGVEEFWADMEEIFHQD